MRLDILEKKEDILQWIDENLSKAEMSRRLHCKPQTLDSYLFKMGIVYTGNQSGKGTVKQGYIPALEYINSNKPISSHKLKIKLIRDGIKEHKCEVCGLSEWNGQPIPIELHHLDGNHYNNNLDNLQVICPNCHAQTDGFAGAGTKKEKQIQNKIKANPSKNYCINCGKEITKGAIRCKSCAGKQKTTCPYTRDELKELIRTKPFTLIAKENNISDNGVRKWCDNLRLPRQKEVIKSYSEEEWALI